MKTLIREFLCRCAAWRAACCDREILSLSVLLPGTLAVGLMLGCLGFFFGVPCGPFPMWVAFGGGSLLALFHSRRRLLAYWGWTACFLVLTAFTFSYTGTDALNYHFPMQHLIRTGWNPLFDSTLEKFSAIADLGRCSVYHTLFLPKGSALVGAFVASATGLWTGDAYLGYVLIYLLFVTAARFYDRFFPHVGVPGGRCVFAAALAFSAKITSFLAGQVDYTMYAALCSALLSLWMLRKSVTVHDTAVFFMAALFCALSKSTGLMLSVLLIVLGGWLCRCSPIYRWAVVGWAAAFLVTGATPYLSSWIQYGSPVYPELTFDPNIEPVDITADFTGNADALSMGYLSRIVYAWISPSLAVYLGGMVSGNPDFSPVFAVAGGVAGMGAAFRIMLLGSAVALALSKKNSVFWLCLFVFAVSNLAPLKYIGYNRYFPQIWVIPFLAGFNLLSNPLPGIRRYVCRWVRIVCIVGVAALTSLTLIRTVAYQGRMMVLEVARQQQLERLHDVSDTWYVSEDIDSYTLRERLRVAGIKVASDPLMPRLGLNRQFLYPHAGSDDEVLGLASAFPVCDSVGALLRFPFVRSFSRLPYPLTERSAQ